MATNVYKGVGVNFGISSSVSNVTGAFQTFDHTFKMETSLLKNGQNQTISKIYSDDSEEATFEYVATGTSGGSVTIVKPTVSDTLTITDPQYGAISGSNWLVDEVSVKASNNDKKKVSLKLSRYPLITS